MRYLSSSHFKITLRHTLPYFSSFPPLSFPLNIKFHCGSLLHIPGVQVGISLTPDEYRVFPSRICTILCTCLNPPTSIYHPLSPHAYSLRSSTRSWSLRAAQFQLDWDSCWGKTSCTRNTANCHLLFRTLVLPGIHRCPSSSMR